MVWPHTSFIFMAEPNCMYSNSMSGECQVRKLKKIKSVDEVIYFPNQQRKYIMLCFTLEFWGFTSDWHPLFQIPNSSPVITWPVNKRMNWKGSVTEALQCSDRDFFSFVNCWNLFILLIQEMGCLHLVIQSRTLYEIPNNI